MDAWEAVGAVGSILAAGVAAWAARQSRSSAQEANKAANTLVKIEETRRRSELTPRFRVSCEAWGPGDYDGNLRLWVMLVGPPWPYSLHTGREAPANPSDVGKVYELPPSRRTQVTLRMTALRGSLRTRSAGNSR
jgi:hypothetical protein